MTFTKQGIFAGFAAFVALIGLLSTLYHPGMLVQAWGAFALLGGAVTINYLYPFAGATPTIGQMQNFNMVIATIQSSAAGDTSAVVTHDFVLPASDISSGFPVITILEQTAEVTTPYELSENPNFTVFGLPGIVGPVKVFIARPNTLVR